jgi:hypothetical protein
MKRVALIFVCFACAETRNPHSPTTPEPNFAGGPRECLRSVSDEAAVQLIVISELGRSWNVSKPWRLDRLSMAWWYGKPTLESVEGIFRNLQPGMAVSVVKGNAARTPLESQWAKCGIELVDAWDRDARREGPAPGEAIKGFFRVSRVGFDEARTQALVYAEYFGSCGTGGWFLLERRSGEWVIVKRGPQWAS